MLESLASRGSRVTPQRSGKSRASASERRGATLPSRYLCPGDLDNVGAVPPPNDAPRVRLGELLVQSGVLTSARLDEALLLQKEEGGKRRLGRLLVESGFVDETQL